MTKTVVYGGDVVLTGPVEVMRKKPHAFMTKSASSPEGTGVCSMYRCFTVTVYMQRCGGAGFDEMSDRRCYRRRSHFHSIRRVDACKVPVRYMERRTDAFLIAFFFYNDGTTGVTRTVAQEAAEKGRVWAARTICEDVSHSPCR